MARNAQVAPSVSAARALVVAAVWIAAWVPATWAIAASVLGEGPAVSRDLLVQAWIAFGHAPVAAALLSRRSAAAGMILAALSVGAGLAALGLHHLDRGALEAGSGWQWTWFLVVWGMVPQLPALAVLPWLFRSPGPVRRGLIGVGAAITALNATTALLFQPSPGPRNPWAVPGWSPVLAQINWWTVAAALASFVAGIGWLCVRARSETPDTRRGIVTLAVGGALTALGLGAMLLVEVTSVTGLVLQAAPLVLGQGLLGIGVLVVVLGRGLWGLDLAVSRFAVVVVVTTLALAGYAGLVMLLRSVLPLSDEVSSLLGVVVVVLAFEPVRRWVTGRIDRLVYGAAAAPADWVRDLGRQVGSGSAAVDDLTAELARALRLRRLEVLPSAEPERQPVGARSFPLTSGGHDVGVLLAVPQPGSRMLRRTVDALADLAPFVAVAVRLDRLRSDVERGRDRLVQVRQEERRLLRRELHDGLGPALAGVGLGLGAVANLIADRPEEARTLVEVLRTEIEARTDDLRTLARTAVPAALDEGRLGAALTDLATRFSDDHLRIEVRVDGADELDTTRQLALYHISAEATLNIRRHSGASVASIDVGRSASGVRLTVQDNGSGWSGRKDEAGVGMTSMRERAEELGGTLVVREAPGGGMTIVVDLP